VYVAIRYPPINLEERKVPSLLVAAMH